jgi:hypothetical protein
LDRDWGDEREGSRNNDERQPLDSHGGRHSAKSAPAVSILAGRLVSANHD